MPVWLGICAHFLFEEEKLNIKKIIGFLISIAAVTIAMSSKANISNGSVLGDIFALLASFLWAAIILMVRMTNLKKSTPEMQLLYQLVVSAIIILPLTAYLGLGLRDITTVSYTHLTLPTICSV